MTGRQRVRRWGWLLSAATVVALAFVAWKARAFEGRPPAEEAAAIRAVLDIRGAATVAEVGAGDGQLAVALAKLLGPDSRVFATELDPPLVARIAQRASGAGLKNVTAVRAAERASNLPPGSCDAVFMRRVYHDLSDPGSILRDLRRVLKPGARLAIIDFEPTVLGNLLMPRRSNRSGHGISQADLARELDLAGFATAGPATAWDDAMFVAVFRAE